MLSPDVPGASYEGAAVPQAPALILIIDDIPANLGVMVDRTTTIRASIVWPLM